MRSDRVAAPLREQVTDRLREAILDFRFKPGQRLIERELIEQTGVSRTTIREVLRQLTAEGLVTTIPQKGAVVVVLTEKEAADLYELRAILEARAGWRFATQATEEQIASLREAFHEFKGLVEQGRETETLLAAKDQFYEVFLEGSGNASIRQTLGGLQARIRLMRAASLSQEGRLAGTVAEIEAIVKAIEARDPEAAAAACEYHVNEAAKVGLQAVSGAPAPE